MKNSAENCVARLTRNRLAFTAVEFLVVALIIGIVAAVTVPRYMGLMTRHSLRAAAKRVALDFEMVMSRAKMTSQSLEIVFSPDDDNYTVANLTGMNDGLSSYNVRLNEEPYRSTLQNAVFDGTSALTINGFGMPEGSGTVVLRRGDWVQVVTINNFGEVIIHPGPTKVLTFNSDIVTDADASL